MPSSHFCLASARRRLFIICSLLLGACSAQAQPATSAATASYDLAIAQAGAALQAKAPCPAVVLFEQAFTPDSLRASVFDLFAAASAAANCPEKTRAGLALAWSA